MEQAKQKISRFPIATCLGCGKKGRRGEPGNEHEVRLILIQETACNRCGEPCHQCRDCKTVSDRSHKNVHDCNLPDKAQCCYCGKEVNTMTQKHEWFQGILQCESCKT